MKNQVLNRFILIILFALLAGIVAAPGQFWTNSLGENNPVAQKLSEFKVTLGLDLAGGTELDYQIDLSDAIAQNSDEDLENDVNVEQIAESVRDALEQRVNPAGVGEIIVKRSQVDDSEHVLIQMPPDTDVEKAKKDAEQDNRLEFFEEDPALATSTRFEIAEYLTVDLTPETWDTKATEFAENMEAVTLESFGPTFADQIASPDLAEQLSTLNEGEIVQEIIETTIQPEYTITDEGELIIDGSPFPRNVLAIARLTEKTNTEREKTTEAEASARHILFGYQGASNVPDDIPYTKEEAKAKAEETLAAIQAGADFAELAQELSTGPTASDGGDLGTFGPGTMVGEFNDAVFALEAPALINEVIETNFGFHVIEVTNLTPAVTQTTSEPQYTYELLAWNQEELSWLPTALGGAQLDAARVGFDEVGNALVDLRFDSEGGALFAEITERVAARQCSTGPCRIGIKVGGQWITTPTVREKIVGRSAQITGNFTFESATELANGLNLGAIDAPVILSGQTTIKAELGEEQLSKSVQAAVFGFLATIVFMIVMYQFAGVIAGVALIIYALIFIMILKIWPASFGGPIVLSLSGAAGIALSIGLAVDGNILIFERMKEEIARGRSLRQAIDLGFERAWSAIRDSNLTTLITCIILFSFGSSVIKGFAITLIVGTILSMFTAVTISRNLLRAALLVPSLNNPKLFGVAPKKKSKK